MASEKMDIGLTDSYDLQIQAGDFTVVESTAQHQQQLILNNKGDYKQNPTVGVGAFDYMDDENYAALIRNISIEFSRDGMDVMGIKMTPEGIINSDAYYK